MPAASGRRNELGSTPAADAWPSIPASRSNAALLHPRHQLCVARTAPVRPQHPTALPRHPKPAPRACTTTATTVPTPPTGKARRCRRPLPRTPTTTRAATWSPPVLSPPRQVQNSRAIPSSARQRQQFITRHAGSRRRGGEGGGLLSRARVLLGTCKVHSRARRRDRRVFRRADLLLAESPNWWVASRSSRLVLWRRRGWPRALFLHVMDTPLPPGFTSCIIHDHFPPTYQPRSSSLSRAVTREFRGLMRTTLVRLT